jgi:NAD(P)-dependent dehydrogenase (short-subunit alcohol dehydrogenase family)
MDILSRFRLDNKIARGTGWRRGIGRTFASALAGAGADIVGASRSWYELPPGVDGPAGTESLIRICA